MDSGTYSSKRTFDTFAELNGNSSSELSSKKARSSPDAPEVLNKVELWNMITALSNETTQSMLFQFCHDNPSLSKHVSAAHQTRLAAERAKPAINFDSYSRECFHALNTKYKRMGGSKQFDMVPDVCEVLESAREAILEKASKDTKWETRRNAMEVLRRISKSVMLCDEGVIRHEIMKDGIELGYFAEAMVGIARDMTVAERERYKDEGFYEKLVDLQTECDWELEMEGLRELYETFDGPDEGEGEREEEEIEDDRSNGGQGGDRQGSDDSVIIVPPPRTRVFSISELS